MSIENTARTAKESPMGMFAEALINPNGFIEAQEARGQAQVVNSQQLPAQGDWEALEALGFVKGEPVEGDDLFVNATIPEGWYKEATDHSMYSAIKDERGIERVSVGYKAAFYDRWAQISIKRVGADVAMHLIYRDEPVSKPVVWDMLTEVEREAALTQAHQYLLDQTDFATQYNKLDDEHYSSRIKRAQETVDLLESL